MTGVDIEDDPNLGILIQVASALGDLRNSLVFVGGCATGLLLTASRAEMIRATQDVDVVAQVATTAQYHQVENAVAARGFTHDVSPDAPICRWVHGGIKLDLLPTDPGILGFHNRWYPLAVSSAVPVTLPGKMTIRLITAPVYLATKLEAFHGRGDRDYLASHDLEDILTVMDGRPELLDEVTREGPEVRQYLAEQFSQLLASSDFVEALPGHLPMDVASQARLPDLLDRIKQIAQLWSR